MRLIQPGENRFTKRQLSWKFYAIVNVQVDCQLFHFRKVLPVADDCQLRV